MLFLRQVFASHSQLNKNWHFGMATNLSHNPRVSVFDQLGNPEHHYSGARLKNQLFLQIAHLTIIKPFGSFIQPHSCSILCFHDKFSKLTFDSCQKHKRPYLWFSPLYPNTLASCSSHYLLCSSHWLRCRRVSLLHEPQMMWKRWMMRLQKNNQGDRNRKLFIHGRKKKNFLKFCSVLSDSEV